MFYRSLKVATQVKNIPLCHILNHLMILYLVILKALGIISNEAQSFAAKVAAKIKYDKEKAAERVLAFIMNIKIEDAAKDVENEKERSKKVQHELEEIVRPRTIAGMEFKKLERSNLESNWQKRKEKREGRSCCSRCCNFTH